MFYIKSQTTPIELTLLSSTNSADFVHAEMSPVTLATQLSYSYVFLCQPQL